MKKTILILLLILPISIISAQKRIVASGNVVTREYTEKPFNSIDINFLGSVVIKQGPEHKVVIKADDNIGEYVRHRVAEEKLFIEISDENVSFNKSEILVEIYTPHLEELTKRGIGEATIEPRTEKRISIYNSGVGDCLIKQLDLEESLEIHNTGVGDIVFPTTVTTPSLFIHNAGVGDVTITSSYISKSMIVNNLGTGDIVVNNMMGWQTENATLQNKGVGDITIRNICAKQLGVKNNGTGDTHLTGQAVSLNLVSAGSGSVSAQHLKSAIAHITHSGVGDIHANVTGTAYISNYSFTGEVDITGNCQKEYHANNQRAKRFD